jgi:hypothetical protein
MRQPPHPTPAPPPSLAEQTAGVAYKLVRFPVRLAGSILRRVAQAVLSILVLVLHPQLRWLIRAIVRSALVRNYLRPAIGAIGVYLYEPYFDVLRRLPPFWATVSIAVPLAVLEPAKLFATILIASKPGLGLLLWLSLHGLSFVLIDRTWTAVRPQSRKIRLVSRLHAWIWLNVAYGKFWITSSPAYRTLLLWLRRGEARLRALRAFLLGKLRRGSPWRQRGRVR